MSPPDLIEFPSTMNWSGSISNETNQRYQKSTTKATSIGSFTLLSLGQSILCKIPINSDICYLYLVVNSKITGGISANDLTIVARGTTVLETGQLVGIEFTYKRTSIVTSTISHTTKAWIYNFDQSIID